MKRRLIYLLCAVLTMALGLASRRWRQHLPWFLGEYGGDFLWAIMLFLLVSMGWPRGLLRWRCSLSLALAYAIEMSQLYHAPWIDNIRNTTLGGLILGFGFLWSDLALYAMGIAAGAGGEVLYILTQCTTPRKGS